MSSVEFQQLRALFDEISDLPRANQLSYLAELSRKNSALAGELADLLEIE